MFQTRPELCPARCAAHTAAAQTRSFSSQLIAERFYPQFEHAIATHVCNDECDDAYDAIQTPPVPHGRRRRRTAH